MFKVHAICGKAASGSLRRTDFAKCNIVANPARLVALHHVMKRLGAEGKLSMPSAVAVYLAKWSEFADIYDRGEVATPWRARSRQPAGSP